MSIFISLCKYSYIFIHLKLYWYSLWGLLLLLILCTVFIYSHLIVWCCWCTHELKEEEECIDTLLFLYPIYLFGIQLAFIQALLILYFILWCWCCSSYSYIHNYWHSKKKKSDQKLPVIHFSFHTRCYPYQIHWVWGYGDDISSWSVTNQFHLEWFLFIIHHSLWVCFGDP